MSTATANVAANDRLNWTRYRPGPEARPLRELLPAGQPPHEAVGLLDPLHDLQPAGQARGGHRRVLGHVLRRRDGRTRRGQGGVSPVRMPIRSRAFSARVKDRGARPRAGSRARAPARRHPLVGPDLRGRPAPALPPADGDVPGRVPEGQEPRRDPLASYQGELDVNGRQDRGPGLGRQPEPQLGEPAHRLLCLRPGRRLRQRAGELPRDRQCPRSKFGPVWTPTLTFLVLRHSGKRVFARLAAGELQGQGQVRLLRLGLLRPSRRTCASRGRIEANRRRLRRPQLLQPAGRHQALPEHQDRLLRADGHRPLDRRAGGAERRNIVPCSKFPPTTATTGSGSVPETDRSLISSQRPPSRRGKPRPCRRMPRERKRAHG